MTGTLADLPERVAAAGIGAPAAVVVGETVALRERIAWLEHRPLAGRRLLVPTVAGTPCAIAGRLRRLGATAEPVPLLRHEQGSAPLSLPPDWAAAGGWLLFTAPAAVEAVLKGLRAVGQDLRALAGYRLGARDAATATCLAERWLSVDRVLERDGDAALTAAAVLVAGVTVDGAPADGCPPPGGAARNWRRFAAVRYLSDVAELRRLQQEMATGRYDAVVCDSQSVAALLQRSGGWPAAGQPLPLIAVDPADVSNLAAAVLDGLQAGKCRR